MPTRLSSRPSAGETGLAGGGPSRWTVENLQSRTRGEVSHLLGKLKSDRSDLVTEGGGYRTWPDKVPDDTCLLVRVL